MRILFDNNKINVNKKVNIDVNSKQCKSLLTNMDAEKIVVNFI